MLLLPLLLLRLLVASGALSALASAGGPGLLSGDGAPGAGILAPLLLALARTRNLRCIFLLLDDAQDLGLEGVREASDLRRRLSWAGAAVSLLPFNKFLSSRPLENCFGRPLNVLTASDGANARFLRQLSESRQWGLKNEIKNDDANSTSLPEKVSIDPVWLVFLLNASISMLFADVTLPFDAETLAAKQYREVTEITEVWRVAPGLPLRDALWGRFMRGQLRPPALSLYDRRSDLQGLHLTVVTQNYPPFSLVNRNANTQQDEAVGFMGNIWNALQNKLHFSTHWLVIPESEPKDRTFAKLTDGRADVALMDFTLTLQRLNKADFSTPVLFTSYRVFIADAGYRLVNWMSYLEPFRPELWAVELLTMATLAVTLATFYHVGLRLLGSEAALEDVGSYTLYNSIFYVFGAFCMQGHDVTPRSCALRVVYLVAYLTAIILMAAYSAALISFLAVQATALPFVDVAGLLADGRYAFATARNSSGHQIIKETTDETLQRLASPGMRGTSVNSAASGHASIDEHDWPQDYLTGLQDLCRRRLALLAPLEYAVTFANRVGCKAVPLPGFRLPVGMSFAFAKHCPYRRVINHNLDRMHKSGALSKLLLDSRPPGGGDATDAGGLTDVDLGDVAPLLAALAAGITSACIFLCAERLLYRRKRLLPQDLTYNSDAPSAPSPPTRLSPNAAPALTHLMRTAKNKFLV